MARAIAMSLSFVLVCLQVGYAQDSAQSMPLKPYTLDALEILSEALRIHQNRVQHFGSVPLAELLTQRQAQLSGMKEQIVAALHEINLSLDPGFLPPMSAAEVLSVIQEDFGQQPQQLFFGLNADAPLMTSADSQTLKAYLPVSGVGKFGLKPVLVKVRRQNFKEVVRRNRQIRNLLLQFARSLLNHPELRDLLESIERDSAFLADFSDEEMDFTKKSAQTISLRRMVPYVPKWWIPVPVPSHIRSRVMTVSFTPGQSPEQSSTEAGPGHSNLIRRAISGARQTLQCQRLF